MRVDERKRIVKVHVGAEYNQTVNGVLTFIWERANKAFRDKYGVKIEMLHCLFCGVN